MNLCYAYASFIEFNRRNANLKDETVNSYFSFYLLASIPNCCIIDFISFEENNIVPLGGGNAVHFTNSSVEATSVSAKAFDTDCSSIGSSALPFHPFLNLFLNRIRREINLSLISALLSLSILSHEITALLSFNPSEPKTHSLLSARWSRNLIVLIVTSFLMAWTVGIMGDAIAPFGCT